MDDAKLPVTPENADQTGVFIASGIGGFQTIQDEHKELINGGPRRVSPFFIPASIINLATGHVSIRFGAKGPNLASCTACAASAHSIGESVEIIRRGDADAMIAGGSEMALTPLSVAGFASMRALSTRNDEPERACRPFDKDRDGFIIGEGAGIVILPAQVTSAFGLGETLDTGPIAAELAAARRALRETIDVGTGKPLATATDESAERARSLAELLLFRLLESLPETRGLFGLNVKMEFQFGPRPAELDLFSGELGLCIEVDGLHHFVDTNAYRRDRRKDALIQRHGLWVIRVLAEDVVDRLDDVRNHVLEAVRARRTHRE
jgi:very-short-patch-repair endonuclease